MPRIPKQILESVFYLYQDQDDVENSEHSGGTGFFVAVQSEVVPTRSDIYAVTCKHIVKPKKGNPSLFMRINTRDGNSKIESTKESDWHSYYDAYPGEQHDVAIRHIGREFGEYDVGAFMRSMFLPKLALTENQVGYGDDVFMVGRYFDHDGVQHNTPSLRFGNISMLPGEPLLFEDEDYEETDSFIVEMHSLQGYSGSPVFTYVPIYRRNEQPNENRFPVPEAYISQLLGIEWSQPLRDEYVKDVSRYVKVIAGMSNVLPAWHIDKLLDADVFKMQRDEADEREKNLYKNRT